jgi:outer membrane biogenesis lipoprotein LolB
MKRFPCLVLLVACMFLTGCVKYQMTLNNGQSFTVLGKPKFNEVDNTYTYKAGGKEQVISAGRVVSIAPTGSSDSDGPQSSGY